MRSGSPLPTWRGVWVTRISRFPAALSSQGQFEFTLRTLGRVARVEDLKEVTVASQGGRAITIGDLGSVEDSTAEMESVALYGAKDRDAAAVLLTVRKQSGTNTVEVARLVKERLAELARRARTITTSRWCGINRFSSRPQPMRSRST